ncbi:MAG: cytochrome c [Microthrixaceae bacterium]|nr:c-type cytochrome [Microthrixaceae bacterium]MCO5313780.1 cytochrome c [Microthrixaceae bacterium]
MIITASRARRSRRAIAAVLVVSSAWMLSACSNEPEQTLDLTGAAAEGQLIAKEMGCQGCHSIDGSNSTGPTWKDLYGAQVTLQGGDKVTVDDDYLVRSIREPNAQRREDARSAMGAYDEKRLSDDDVAKIIEFIKALS